jgi:tRNA (cytidine/uridine-2'-O-)-methyltransferase
MRLAACMGKRLHIIYPCGFSLSDRRFRRAVMDYSHKLDLDIHENWPAFLEKNRQRRLVLICPEAATSYTDFLFTKEDCLILGKESCGFPTDVLETITHQVRIPMVAGVRSLNVAIAGAMVFSEALRQTQLLP